MNLVASNFLFSVELSSLLGDPALEKDTLPWRLKSDLSLVVSSDKAIQPLCKYLRKLAIEQGIGQLEIEDHELKARFHPVARTTILISQFLFFHVELRYVRRDSLLRVYGVYVL